MGGYKNLLEELKIDDTWQKIFVEPNPEHWEIDTIDKKIDKIPNAILLKNAVSSENCFCYLYTRSDLVGHTGDSAATIQSLDFLKKSIGDKFNQNAKYKQYLVECITIEDIFKITDADELYIKIDAEGSEFDILYKFPFEYLPRVKRMFVEFHCQNKEMTETKYSLINKFEQLGLQIENWD